MRYAKMVPCRKTALGTLTAVVCLMLLIMSCMIVLPTVEVLCSGLCT